MTPVTLVESEADARAYVGKFVDAAATDRLGRFAELLIEENKHQNLISRASEKHIWQRHIADSAQLLEHVPRETLEREEALWLDLGTGAGPPGLVIAALLPDLQVRLVESRARRVAFLKDCVEKLGLDRCQVLGDRLERVQPFHASVISARAFAPLDKLLRLSAPFSTAATTHLLPKGRSAAHELEQQKAPIRKMFHVEQSLTDRDAGIIVSSPSHK
ncbi:16S rRNA (guanine(527)-N(7))-methyltransferase RsmG [Erythrobacter ani]|uniref:Ribosomal RNA small subunit methyltransferase G n=1 Tax=Erythrobacter ani TaxID=2827235 RepID=A0ABS6SKP4_9SPHN|nr:16S rRNA (guanine(527)-N(7))-methyltransferase RsmG [Erythrobacter ani]MBV7265600.1 16S rRNA (guanine(527)-N(7))-methyltransferase RsmG [Erythrobacter ani]